MTKKKTVQSNPESFVPIDDNSRWVAIRKQIADAVKKTAPPKSKYGLPRKAK